MAKRRSLPKLRPKEKKRAQAARGNGRDETDEESESTAVPVGKVMRGGKSSSRFEEEIDEDDSIDDEGSEIGWNSDDEAAYGQLFNKRSREGEDEEEDEELEDEEEVEGGMLLSDMLSSSNQTNSQPVVTQQSEEEEDYDEELEEDEGGESGEDSENEYAYDEDDDEDGDHDKLLAAIEKYSKPTQQPTPAPRSNSKAFQLSTESPFSSLQSNQTISLESLINSLENPSSSTALPGIDQETFKAVKTNLKSLNSSVSAPKYTHKVQSDRAEREVTYQQTSADMKKWQNLIRENQASKSLDLRQDKRSLPSTRSMITTFQPQTDMEKEIQMILLNPNSKTQHNELEIERNEEDELLHSKELTHEELKQKQKELSKIKSLLFFEQMKRHRINKIKSKTFHRILKKKKLKKKMTSKEYNEMVQKLRNNGEILDEDFDQDGDEEEGAGEKETEEEAIRRIKERMDLRHKNTGKWARMALVHGKGSKSLREAYHESVLLGNELTKKAMSLNEDDNPYPDDLPRRRASSADSDDMGRKSKKLRIVDEASESLDHILDSGTQDQELNGKYKALFEMDFMKKARQQQQLKAKEEAQKLLREIEQMEEGISDSESENEGSKEQQKISQKKTKESLAKHKEKLEQARKQMTELMNGNNSMSLANPSVVAVTQPQSTSLQNNPWLDSTVAAKSRDVNAIIGDSTQGKVHQKAKQRTIKNAIIKSDDSAHEILKVHDENEDGNNEKEGATRKRSQSTKSNSMEKKLGSISSEVPSVNDAAVKTDQQPTRKPLLMQKSQQDLVNLAFAGPDYDADFQALKEKIIDEELNISDKKRKILSDDKAGWGDWAGPGMVGVSPHVVKKRQRLLKNLDEKKAELRAGRTDGALANVILSEKRIKTTAKYKLADVPHPFKTREEYERSLQMPVGNEWNAEHIVRKNTKPEVLLRAGRIIEPIKLPKQRKSANSNSRK